MSWGVSMYVTVVGIELYGHVEQVIALPEPARSILDNAAAPRRPIEEYMSPRGAMRHMDPVALWIAELLRSSDLDFSDCAIHCISMGATRHYFEVTRRMLAAEPFSPLAYSNRSCNAVAAQVSQLMGIRGGAAAYYGTRCSDLLSVIRRRVRDNRRALICGGHIRSGSMPSSLYDAIGDIDFCYCLMMSGSKAAGGPSQWKISGIEMGADGMEKEVADSDGLILTPTSYAMGPLTPLITAALCGSSLQRRWVRVVEDTHRQLTISKVE